MKRQGREYSPHYDFKRSRERKGWEKEGVRERRSTKVDSREKPTEGVKMETKTRERVGDQEV